jgi:hypothetical protein
MLDERLSVQNIPLNITSLTKDDEESTTKLKNMLALPSKKGGANIKSS